MIQVPSHQQSLIRNFLMNIKKKNFGEMLEDDQTCMNDEVRCIVHEHMYNKNEDGGFMTIDEIRARERLKKNGNQ
jgi:hypothetical protein